MSRASSDKRFTNQAGGNEWSLGSSPTTLSHRS